MQRNVVDRYSGIGEVMPNPAEYIAIGMGRTAVTMFFVVGALFLLSVITDGGENKMGIVYVGLILGAFYLIGRI